MFFMRGKHIIWSNHWTILLLKVCATQSAHHNFLVPALNYSFCSNACLEVAKGCKHGKVNQKGASVSWNHNFFWWRPKSYSKMVLNLDFFLFFFQGAQLLCQVLKFRLSRWDLQKLTSKDMLKRKWLHLVLDVNFMTLSTVSWTWNFCSYSLKPLWTWGHHQMFMYKLSIKCHLIVFKQSYTRILVQCHLVFAHY